MEELLKYAPWFAYLIAWAIFVRTIIEALKVAGIVAPGTAQRWSMALNAVIPIALAIAKALGVEALVEVQAAQLLPAVPVVTQLIEWGVGIVGTALIHKVFNWLGLRFVEKAG